MGDSVGLHDANGVVPRIRDGLELNKTGPGPDVVDHLLSAARSKIGVEEVPVGIRLDARMHCADQKLAHRLPLPARTVSYEARRREGDSNDPALGRGGGQAHMQDPPAVGMIAKGSHGVAGNTYAGQLWCSIALPSSDNQTRGHHDEGDR